MIKRPMKIKVFTAILAFILVFMNCYVPEAHAAKNKGNGKKQEEPQNKLKKKMSNQRTDIIVKYKNDSKKDNTLNAVKSKTKVRKLEQKNHMKRQRVSIYEVDEKDDINKIIKELNADPNVEYAQPNYQLTAQAVPTDDQFGSQWSLYNDGQDVDGYTGRAGVDIGAIPAWDITMGSKEVVIGILDTGIDISHTDLKNNIFVNTGEIPGNGIDDDGNGYIDDVYGWDFANDDASVYDTETTDTHGTYVAGIIAAGANNGGITGIAPKVKVLPLKFINGTTGYTSDAIEAIEYAMNMGVEIINCSFGGTDNNIALKEAMENSGILFICSAGNRGADVEEKPVYPAAFDIDNILSVAAVDSKGVIPGFSSYGAGVDVAAPGISILSTIPKGGYGYYSGTSVSAAITSGVAGLVKSYLPDMDAVEIKDRMLSTVVPCTNLAGKVDSSGRVHAFSALSGTIQPEDNYTGEGNYDDILPIPDDGEADSWYLMDEFASNVERFHYGVGGINPASGNYSVTCTDMSIASPGLSLDVSRSYNSKDQRQTLLGRGWTFGFEGRVTNKGSVLEVSLPDGSAHVFHYKNGKYIGEGTRASFVRNVSGVDILTTKEQYKYGFDSSHNKMIYMEDRNGNRITMTYTSGKLSKITDTAGRVYNLTYNNKNLLSGITDTSGRSVTYEYNSYNLLTKVTDPQGGVLTYEYDSSQFMTKLIDQNGHTFQQLTYSHSPGDAQNKVVKSKDAAGETWNYSYNMAQRNTTITNNENKKWTYWFDAAMFTIRVQDPEGRLSYTEYTFQDSNTYYGDVKAQIDRNGNRTDYDVDLATGNITKVTYPDGGAKTFVYDAWHNVIEECTGEMNGDNFIPKRKTFYIFDATGKRLLKKVQPLDGKSKYIVGNISDFAIESYDYYTKSGAKASFGCEVDGLLKSVTDPEGNVTTYTYNSYGDIASIKDPIGNITAYTYDKIGQKLSETTGAGDTFKWEYDKNGMVIREIHPDGGIKRTVYNAAGYILIEAEPMQYEPAKDNKTTGIYTGIKGTRYEWYDNGYLKAEIDADSNRTEYTYDIFGNKKTEKKPNGSIYRYEYDALNRLTKMYFKESTSSSEVLLSETAYGILTNGNMQTTVTGYADKSQKVTIATIEDYAGREVEIQYGNYRKTRTAYHKDGTTKLTVAANGAITYYRYDSLGALSDVYKPMSIVDGITMYSWMGYTYDKAGRVIEEKTGKSLVPYDPQSTSNPIPADMYVKNYVYEYNKVIKETDSEGRYTSFLYDGKGRVIRKEEKVSEGEAYITDTTYNYLDLPVSITMKIRNGDISGNDYGDNATTDITARYEYDLNGNVVKVTDVAGNMTTHTYDTLNRILFTTKELKDGKGKKVADATTSRTYTWDGKPSTQTDAMGNTTSYIYDAMGNQVKIIDALGNTTYKEYDRLGRETTIVSPKNYIQGEDISNMERTLYTYDEFGRVIKQTEVYKKMTRNSSGGWDYAWKNVAAKTYEYDTLGNVTKTTDALGNAAVTDYNLAGLPEYIIDAETTHKGLGYTVKYTYNGLGQKVKETYDGAVYNYTYDGAGNVLKTEINNRIKSTAEYDLLGRAVSITDGNGKTIHQKWNAFHKIAETVTPGDDTIPSNCTIYQYDKLGNLIRSKDSVGTVTTYVYDSLGRNLSIAISDTSGTDAVTTKASYDLNGNVLSQTDGNGNTSTMRYDALGRKIAQINGLGQETTYTYDKNNNKIMETNHLGNSIQMVYDGMNRLVEKRDAYRMVIQQLMYNDADAQEISFDALGNEIRFHYDKNLRQTGTTDGEGNRTYISYDFRGNISSKKDGNGNTTTYAYDEENRLVSVTDAMGNRTMYSYDTNGNLISQTDGNSNTRAFVYNAANLLISRTDPGSGKGESYTYLANGLMAGKTDRNGVVTGYTYDIFGRLLSEEAGGQIKTYTYDNNGNLLTMADADGTTVRTYDALNRNISKRVPGIGKSTYQYDLPIEEAGEYAEKTTDPKGNVTLRTYDRAGRLHTVQGKGEEPTRYSYYSNGSRHKITYPDGATQTYTYDRKNQAISLTNKSKEGSIRSSYQYTYDGAGNQLTKTEAKGTTVYTYDSLNRLSTVTEPEGRITSYTYDGAGNRSTETIRQGETSVTTTYRYNPQNLLTATKSTNGEETKYLYDANGNLLTKSTGVSRLKGFKEGNQEDITLPKEDLPGLDVVIRKGDLTGTGTGNMVSYTYDNYNRLTGLRTGKDTLSYTYNAQGYRVGKTVNGKTTMYLYEQDKVVLETDGNNKQTAYNVYGSGLLYREAGTEGYYYLYNAHGDVTSLIDKKGSIAATYDYDAFGNILNETGTADNPIRYGGYQYDKESELYYLNARYYDSKIARFITEDTYRGRKHDPLSLNLYTYCHNNPLIYIDPSGHAAMKIGDSGSNVKALQKQLSMNGYAVTVDGKFGPQTQAAVKQYQDANKLKVDGIVGTNTINSLRASTGSIVTTTQAKTAVNQVVPEPISGSSSGNTPKATASGTSNNNSKTGSQVTNTNKATNTGVSNAKNNITPKTVKESNVISIPVFVPEAIVVTGGTNVVSSVTSKVVSVAIKWSSPVILGATAWWSQSITAGGTLSDEQIKEKEGNATQGDSKTEKSKDKTDSDVKGKEDLNNIDPNNLPDGWTKTENNGFTHIRDSDGNIRVRIDPPDKVTNYPHKHIYDTDGNPLDINGNIVSPKSPDAHIPLK